MKTIYINKLFLATGFALFFDHQDYVNDLILHDPYVTSKKIEISDEDFEKLKEAVDSKNDDLVEEMVHQFTH